MKAIFTSGRRAFMAIGLSVATALPMMASPVAAAPIAPIAQPSVPAASSAVTDVQYRDWRRDRGRYDRRGWRGDRRYYRGRDRNRAGAALALGLGIGALGALAVRPRYDYYEPGYRVYAPPRRIYRERTYGNSHVDWCYARYRSYRAYDNTFQPYNGPRQSCYSPYS